MQTMSFNHFWGGVYFPSLSWETKTLMLKVTTGATVQERTQHKGGGGS